MIHSENRNRWYGVWNCLLIVIWFWMPAGSSATPDITQQAFEDALNEIRTYERSQSRAPMFLIETYIRENQDSPEILQVIEENLTGLLSQNVTNECRLFVCRQLWRIGTDRSVPALAVLLNDESTVDIAIYALNSNPSPASCKALRVALDRAQGNAAIALINVLGERRDAEAVKAIVKRIDETDKEVTQAALAALGKIGTEQCAEALAKARRLSDFELAEAASHAYLQCAGELSAKHEMKTAAAIYRELLAPSESAAIRRGALTGWVETGSDDAIKTIESVLSGGDPELVTAAIGCLRTLTERKDIQRIAKASESFEPEFRIAAIDALADKPNPAVKNAAIEATQSTDREVRIHALRALGKVGDRESVDLLVPFLSEQYTEDERNAARISLQSLTDDGVDQLILYWLKQVEATAKVNLISVIAERGFHDAVPELLPEVQSADLDVHHAAIQALGALGREQDLPDLIHLLNSPSCKDDWGQLEAAIVQTANRIESPTARTHPIFTALSRTNEPKMKCSLFRILSELGTDLARKVLRDALRDPNIQVRYSAFQSYLHALSNATDKTDAEKVKDYRLALHWAKSLDETKIVLTAAAGIGQEDALDLVVPYLDQIPLRECAASSAVAISAHLTDTDGPHVKEVLHKILSFTQVDEVRSKAQALLKDIGKYENYITNWQISGAYRQEGKTCLELFDIAFPPEEPNPVGIQWRSVPQGINPDHPWLVDVGQLLSEEENQVTYLYTWFESPIEGMARLEMGSDDGMKVWLNGKLVHTNNVTRAVAPGEDTVEVPIQAGWNSLLVKLTQNTSTWGMCLRVQDRDGNPLDGILVNDLHPDVPRPLAK